MASGRGGAGIGGREGKLCSVGSQSSSPSGNVGRTWRRQRACPREGRAWPKKPGQPPSVRKLPPPGLCWAVRGAREASAPENPRAVNSFFGNTFPDVAEVLAEDGE